MAVESSFPTSMSSLLLPSSASQSFSSTLSSLKRSTLCITNRLHSIYKDSLFVQNVALKYNLPLVANERCGSWYTTPEQKAGSAYFKSTDGHWGQWSFSTRRLNLHILDIIERSGGCVIVDSTRRGKSMPDALSKTIPIWCAVINRLLFEDLQETHKLRTPKEVVSASEHAQIEALLSGFVDSVKRLGLDLCFLRSTLKKSLRPSWITQDSISTNESSPSSADYHTIVCCTASRRVHGAEMTEDGYIQGAGDDSEGWSKGLTPSLFWSCYKSFLAAVEEDIQDLIQSVAITDQDRSIVIDDAVMVGPTGLYVGTLSSAAQAEQYDGIIICGGSAPSELDRETMHDRRRRKLDLLCGDGKLGSRALRSQLPRIPPFIASLPDHGSPPKILCTCSTGKDLSVGVALVVLCLFFDDTNCFSRDATRISVDKALIRQRLATIMIAKPDSHPSRSTLQSVNSFLMPRID